MHLVSVWPTLMGMKDTSFISASLLRQLLLSRQARASVSFPDKQLFEEMGRATYRPYIPSPDLSWSCQPPIPVARGSRAGRGRGGRAVRGRGSKGGKNRDRRGGRGKRLLRVDRRGQGNLAFQVFGWLGSLPVYKVLEVSGQNNPSALFSSRELREKECFPGRGRQS